MSYELIDLFKKAVYAFKEIDDYEKLHGEEDDYTELELEIPYDYYLKKFFDIIDNGDKVLSYIPDFEMVELYILDGIDYSGIEYYDFLWYVFFEVYDNIEKSNYSEFEILIQAYEYLDYCIFIKNELPKIKDKGSVEIDYLKSKFKTEQQDKIKKEGYEIWGNGGEPGSKCYDCGSTYTEYMSEGVWHCCNCDEYFEPGLF